ncbi:hypothetical protein ACFWOJ_32580 [Streptomyces sp. NPDC058439]|uniref:hypothetical protein n=1 Tax=Streptomyces sp. NPDC058439 TaxID=3346500 RepID=UPI003654A65F
MTTIPLPTGSGGRTRKAGGNVRRNLSRFRTRGLRCAAEPDERTCDFLGAADPTPRAGDGM